MVTSLSLSFALSLSLSLSLSLFLSLSRRSEVYDRLGDSFTEIVKLEELERLLTEEGNAAAADASASVATLSTLELSEFVHEELAELSDRRIFNNCMIAFYPSMRAVVTPDDAIASLHGDASWVSSAQAVVGLGGSVQDGEYTAATTHVVCDPSHADHAEHVATLHAYCRKRVLEGRPVFKLMPLSWVVDSVAKKQRLDDTSNQIKIRSADVSKASRRV